MSSAVDVSSAELIFLGAYCFRGQAKNPSETAAELDGCDGGRRVAQMGYEC